MRVLIGCECSGIVRAAFRRGGHDAWSCDLQPAEDDSPFHHQEDVLAVAYDGSWDLGIFHPPCTYLCSSGLHWNGRTRGREAMTEAALRFVRRLLDAPIHRIALENPIGCISTRIRPYDQRVQPHQFGDDASKSTCLWLKNLPPLMPTHVEQDFFEDEPPSGRLVAGVRRYSNQTDSGQNKLGPSDTRAQDRSRTYPGIAKAMAAQWGKLL